MSVLRISEQAHLLDCPIDPAVWLETAEFGEAEVVIEVQAGASLAFLAAELSGELDTVPIVLDRFILSVVSLDDALVVLLPLTRWGDFLLRVPVVPPTSDSTGVGDPGESATTSELRRVPWSTHDERRKDWLELLVASAREKGTTRHTFDELVATCRRRVPTNHEQPIAGVSLNRRVDST